MLSSPQSAHAAIFTFDNVFSGAVLTKGHRVADLLHEQTTRFLEIQDVTIDQPRFAEFDPIQVHSLSVRKRSILFVSLDASHEAPVRRLYNYVARQSYDAKLVFPGFVLSGKVHLPARSSAMTLLGDFGTVPTFLAATDVLIQSSFVRYRHAESHVVLFNREWIEALQIGDALDSNDDEDVAELAQKLRELTPGPATPSSAGGVELSPAGRLTKA